MNESINKNIMMIAGEVSGDYIGAVLIEELKKLDDRINVFGLGGDRMKDAGMNILYHIKRMAFLGFAEIVKHIPFIRRVQSELMAVIRKENIKYAILIDYPGFNLNFAKKIKSAGVKVIYYISPQIWAWGGGRIKKIKKLVDKMIVVFPFEEDLYKSHDMNVELVGHPLIQRIGEYKFLSRQELLKKFDLPDKEILLVMPGSREHEVEKIFPEVILAAEKLAKEFDLQVIAACSTNIDENLLFGMTPLKNFKIVKGFTYDLMKYAKLGIIKSGTSTLEAGLFGLPMVIVYRTSLLTYLIGKNLVKVDSIGMANIISGEKVVPELIQKDVNKETIYYECRKILTDRSLYNNIKSKLELLREKLSSESAHSRASDIIYSLLNEA